MNKNQYEIAKILSEDDTNYTIESPLKSILEFFIKIVLIIFLLYFIVFTLSGIIIKHVPIEKQIEIENYITKISTLNNIDDNIDISKAIEVRNRILEYDYSYPKTSNLNIKILNENIMNAYCYPNGNIYITKFLYNKIKNDEEMLTFLIAHEMGHYKHRDHLMMLRKNISNFIVLLTICILSQDESRDFVNIVNNAISLGDLKYSRNVESKADLYASSILKKIYGNNDGGIKMLSLLKNESYGNIELLSTHPKIENRIKILKNN